MTHSSGAAPASPGRPDPSAGAASTTGTASTTGGPTDRVELRVPADPAYLSVLRTATAGLAARLDMTLDEIEDVRIAVDEACALVLGPQALDGSGERHGVEVPVSAGPGGEEPGGAGDGGGAGDDVGVQPVLRAVFDLGGDGMRVAVSGPARTLPDRGSWAWVVLEALVSSLSSGRDEEGRWCVRLHHAGPRHAG